MNRDHVLDVGAQMLKILSRLGDSEAERIDTLLESMGLERRRGWAQPMACFAAGAIIGASAGLFLAPTRGAQFRRKIVTFFAGEIDRVTSPAKPVRITAKPGHAHP